MGFLDNLFGSNKREKLSDLELKELRQKKAFEDAKLNKEKTVNCEGKVRTLKGWDYGIIKVQKGNKKVKEIFTSSKKHGTKYSRELPFELVIRNEKWFAQLKENEDGVLLNKYSILDFNESYIWLKEHYENKYSEVGQKIQFSRGAPTRQHLIFINGFLFHSNVFEVGPEMWFSGEMDGQAYKDGEKV